MVTISCLVCNKEKNVSQSEINRGNGKFCSRACALIGKRIGSNSISLKVPNVTCAQCGKAFYKNQTKMKNSKSGLYFCSRECKDQAQRIGGIKEIMPPHYGQGSGRSSYRETSLKSKPAICERCGYCNHIAAIVVHHKDRNRDNNCLENLEVLCANCHAIEHFSNEKGVALPIELRPQTVHLKGFEPL